MLEEAVPTPPRCALEEEYGAALVLDRARVAVNFVSTLDGVVSFGAGPADSRKVGGGLAADRLLMAMLRAVAGVIVVGAGTLRATPGHQWTPREMAPEREADLAQLRTAAGLEPGPAPLVVVSGTGDLPAGLAALSDPETPVHVLGPGGMAGAGALPRAGAMPARHWSGAEVVAAAAALASGPILCEGGPHLLGTLLEADVPLDLFLTLAPQLAGRRRTPERLGLVEGVAFEPFQRASALRSVRRSGDHLLLRYAVDRL